MLWNNRALVHEDQLPSAMKSKKERQRGQGVLQLCLSAFCDNVTKMPGRSTLGRKVHLGSQLQGCVGWCGEATAEPMFLVIYLVEYQEVEGPAEGGGYNLQMPTTPSDHLSLVSLI